MLKRLLDVGCAALGLVVLSPVLALVALLIKFDSRGPAFFIQERLGKDLRVFRMYKFRTMVVDAERMGTGLFSYAGDDRITRVGRFLRQTSLDELPQLFNVLGGSMSVVGPRPPVTYELGPLGDFTETMRVRFRVKPGITGLAQISGRNDLEWPEKINFDNRYVELYAQWGVLVDLRILLLTIFVVLTGRGVVERRRDAASR